MNGRLQKKVDRSIRLIRAASKVAAANGCPEIEVCYSGGKDSDVILELVKMSGVPYRAIYKNTSIDPVGTIKHAKDNGVEVMKPKRTFLQLISEKGFPNRRARFCCEVLKEYKILDYAILGIRASESARRKARYKEPEQCRVYNKKEKTRQYFPILDWDLTDLKEFVTERGIKLHPLYYDENGGLNLKKRCGCIGCPLGSREHRLAEFTQYPNMLKLYAIGGAIP